MPMRFRAPIALARVFGSGSAKAVHASCSSPRCPAITASLRRVAGSLSIVTSMTQAASDSGPPPYGPSRPARSGRSRRLVVLVGIAIALLVILIVASRITLNYYVLSPGYAQPVGPLVKVPAGKGYHLKGRILLTDVYLSQLTLLGWIPAQLSSDDQVVSGSELVDPGVPVQELDAQSYAKAAALRYLGYQVPEHDAGVVVTAVTAGSPAQHVLKVGQIVTAIDSTPTQNLCAFVSALRSYSPGQTVTLSVEQVTFSSNGVLKPGATVMKNLTLASRPAGTGISGCQGQASSKAFLGIVPQTQQDYSYPFSISVDTSGIGGPSAGLSMTLGIIDVLGGGDLTGGRSIAATGTIDASGAVGDVGGVAQKTVAVERAGATAFLVPPPEYEVALSKATPSLHIYKVSTLAQALADIRKLGGHLPPRAVTPSG